ncbi:glycoside hydrolase family 3 N-terminal domain-containing protein [Streptomyces sp. NPDC060194]|uniref:glycoside hydrolase family 3 protein n=1 Tax=Streptomyces sp. NPDC060194 TaxID=3347069 RepID=UPI003658CD58
MHHPHDDDLRARIAGMTAEEKVGQLFVTRVYGETATDPSPEDVRRNRAAFGVATGAELVAEYHVGGIIYFAWAHNTTGPEQIAALSAGLQQAARTPLLIATDQEHGTVTRIGSPATLLPGAMAIGASGSRTDARDAARIAGTELAELGIRQDYAPCADVNVNPANPVIGVRSFGSDPHAVADLVAAQVEGYTAGGVAAAVKHFPGHGDTETDSHHGLPVIHHSREEWERLDAPPFRAAVAAGAGCVMTAHIVVPALDPSGDPATLSRPIVTGILRDELGFDGVVVTDDLGMAGVRQTYGDERVPVLALLAGCDQLLNPPDLRLARDAVLAALADGELEWARVEESVLRILRQKARLGLLAEAGAEAPANAGAATTLGSPAHLAVADRIADRSVTLLVDSPGALPLDPAVRPRLLVTGADPESPSGTTGPPTAVLAAALSGHGFRARAVPPAEAVAAAAEADAVVVTTCNVPAGRGTPQDRLVAELTATALPVVTVALRNPYDAARLPAHAAALAVYSWGDAEMRSAARVLAGVTSPVGRLPVPVPDGDDPEVERFPLGHGLGRDAARTGG